MSKTCQNCKNEIPDDARFCSNCGAQQPTAASQQTGYTRLEQEPGQQQTGQQQSGYARSDQEPVHQSTQSQSNQGRTEGNPFQQAEYVFDYEDVEKNKVIAALAYLIFFLPLIAAPNSKFGKFHANQGLLLLILAVGGNIVLNLIPFFGFFLEAVYSIFMFVLFLMGLINTLNGKARELPLIGQYRIIN